MIAVETDRLLLRPFASADAQVLHDLWTSPGVRRFLWDDTIIPIGQTKEIISRSEQLFVERQFGLWGAWTTRQALVGFGGLWFFRHPPELELLFGVAEDSWGQGYATELARRIVDYAFVDLKMPAVRASTDAGNLASTRVLEKLGFTFTRRQMVADLDTMFYQLNAPS